MKLLAFKLSIYFLMFSIIYYFSVNKHIMFRHTDHVKEIIKINNENLSYKRIKYEIDQKKNHFS